MARDQLLAASANVAANPLRVNGFVPIVGGGRYWEEVTQKLLYSSLHVHRCRAALLSRPPTHTHTHTTYSSDFESDRLGSHTARGNKLQSLSSYSCYDELVLKLLFG